MGQFRSGSWHFLLSEPINFNWFGLYWIFPSLGLQPDFDRIGSDWVIRFIIEKII